MPKQINLNTLRDTEKLANKLAQNLRGGSVLALIGELGAGKTTFTQALGRALNIKKNIKSPTFTVLQTYTIPRASKVHATTLCHVDAYRISDPHELDALGLYDYLFDANTITIIEWADRVRTLLPPHTKWITVQNIDGKRTAILD